MTEPSPSRPVPGPPLSQPPGEPEALPAAGADPGAGLQEAAPFADLEQLPVADHVAVFEAEHSRLQDELSTIDRV